MSLSSRSLDAFLAVAREKSFSTAAKTLHLTQSALSQRVLNLESELGTALFIREPSGLVLTALGEKLLRYCQSKEILELEFLAELKAGGSQQLSGLLRIAGFSSLTRSVLVPVLGELIQKHPNVQIDLMNDELRELPGYLISNKADFVFMMKPFERQGVESHVVGVEENVMIESVSRHARKDVYLDHDVHDTTTFDFFSLQGKKIPPFRRAYLDEIDTLVEGVRHGLGRAIVPIHIARAVKGVQIVEGYKSLKMPIYLCHYTQPFYPRLYEVTIDLFLEQIKGRLSG